MSHQCNCSRLTIPLETELLGRKIKILFNTDLRGRYGYASLVNSNIHIATSVGGVKVPESEMAITYLHEITHLILAKGGFEKKIRSAGIDLEDIVESIAVGMHQILTKARYGERKPIGGKKSN